MPVNTIAIVYLPATTSSKIFSNSVEIRSNDYVVKDNIAVMKVGSGEYKFEVRPQKDAQKNERTSK